MNERDEVRLRDMLDVAYKAASFVNGKVREELETNDMLLFALARAIEIIGEAANGVSPETVESLPQIPWKKIVGMRNRMIHGYQALDHDIIWDTATIQVPELIVQLEKVLTAE